MPRKASNGPANPNLIPEGEPGWKIDLSTWKMGEFMLWTTAAREGDLKTLTVMMSECVDAWPFEGDPTDFEAYKTLSPKDWKRAVGAISAATANAFQ